MDDNNYFIHSASNHVLCLCPAPLFLKPFRETVITKRKFETKHFLKTTIYPWVKK